MTTGITADIYEGKDLTLSGYLMRVARSYMLAIMQREDDPDAPLRRDEPDHGYHNEQIRKAESMLVYLDGLSVEEAGKKAKVEYEEAEEHWRGRRAKALALRSRYEAMVAQVESWEPDPLVAYLKDGALEQLHKSLEFDCGEPGEEMRYYPAPKLQTGAEWMTEQRQEAERQIEYAREQIAKRDKVAAQRNEHIDAFLRSLPDTEASS